MHALPYLLPETRVPRFGALTLRQFLAGRLLTLFAEGRLIRGAVTLVCKLALVLPTVQFSAEMTHADEVESKKVAEECLLIEAPSEARQAASVRHCDAAVVGNPSRATVARGPHDHATAGHTLPNGLLAPLRC